MLDEPVSALDVSIQAQVDQPARRPAGRARADVHVRRPRPLGRAPRHRPDRGHVPRQDRRALAGRGALRQADPPVHARAARRDPDPRPAREPRARSGSIVAGEPPNPIDPPPGCRFRHALPARAGDLPPRRAAAQPSTRAAISPPATSRSRSPPRRPRAPRARRRARSPPATSSPNCSPTPRASPADGPRASTSSRRARRPSRSRTRPASTAPACRRADAIRPTA